MRRRCLLAAVALSATTGCSAAPDAGSPTLSPAPIGTDNARTASGTDAPDAPVCPALPSNAEVYVCAPTADDDGLTLSVGRTDGGAPLVTLRNGSTLAFDTGADWWTLARRVPADGGPATTGTPDPTTPARWRLVDQGDGMDSRRLEPGGRFRWLVGDSEARTSAGTRRVDVSLPVGEYAFSIVGYVPGGELTAVVRPFEARGR